MFVCSMYNLKGGVGKTASSVNFAYLAASEGYKTLLWDFDPQGASSFYFKATAIKPDNQSKEMDADVALSAAIVCTEYEGLDIIPADHSAGNQDFLHDGKYGSKEEFKKLLEEVLYVYDFVFFDCPPGFSTIADNVFSTSDMVLMSVIPTTLSVRTYEQVINHFNNKHIPLEKLRCFFSMVDSRKAMHKSTMKNLDSDNRFFNYYIPYLSDIEKMGLKNAPVTAYSPSGYASVCYRALWDEIKSSTGT